MPGWQSFQILIHNVMTGSAGPVVPLPDSCLPRDDRKCWACCATSWFLSPAWWPEVLGLLCHFLVPDVSRVMTGSAGPVVPLPIPVSGVMTGSAGPVVLLPVFPVFRMMTGSAGSFVPLPDSCLQAVWCHFLLQYKWYCTALYFLFLTNIWDRMLDIIYALLQFFYL